ncbi:MAG: Glutamine--fructose-6-phosphate aminotransferase (isomerizing) [Parcubacteria group bacterium ADurb.Bin326]|nr:MAG: Glutamine--fructose-6-phosphate aminotransferase (isomerizing) [Parcubacteria group bacterium ADurb.Bin326]
MCGIFGYVGKRQAAPLLIDGLKALEYRGYDSAGLYIVGAGCAKAVGQVKNLETKLGDGFSGNTGLAHTRWATHGVPSEVNSHPHSDCEQKIWLAHNGIIENYNELKEELISKGHKFVSATDTEVVAHLIEENIKSDSSFSEALLKTLKAIRGTYGLVISSVHEPEKIFVARKGSPIVLGIGEGENFVASDPSAIVPHTKRVIYLNDGEWAILTAGSYQLFDLEGTEISREPQTIEWSVEQTQKGGYDHFMMKEIVEGDNVIKNSLRGRLDEVSLEVKLPELDSVANQLKDIKRIIITSCGTALYSGMVGEYMIEELAKVPVEIEYASEFRYRSPIIEPGTMIMSITQSGETADTLAAIREAKRQGALVVSIVNTVGSTIARESDAVMFNQIGPEIGVASTKAFMSQVTLFALFTLYLGKIRGTINEEMYKKVVQEIIALPDKIKSILSRQEEIKLIADKYSRFEDFLFMGRKYTFPIAFEGALKLKEISYVHAEGYGAGEMKHGPIAMIDENFPTVALALSDAVYEKMVSNIEEIKARSGKVLAIATEGNTTLSNLADDVIYVPETIEMLEALLAVVPLQIFAYYIGVGRGYNVDKPRNLAKSVTVE